jgi:hypothetical protein
MKSSSIFWVALIGVCLFAYRNHESREYGGQTPASTIDADSDSDSSASSDSQSFHGYPCTVDCSGHEAGYQWAEEHDITDPDDCGGNSKSFMEGCQSYAEEQSGEDRDNVLDGPDEDRDPE